MTLPDYRTCAFQIMQCIMNLMAAWYPDFTTLRRHHRSSIFSKLPRYVYILISVYISELCLLSLTFVTICYRFISDFIITQLTLFTYNLQFNSVDIRDNRLNTQNLTIDYRLLSYVTQLLTESMWTEKYIFLQILYISQGSMVNSWATGIW